MSDPFIEREIIKYRHELDLLRKYQVRELAAIIREIGFSCNLCGDCCQTSHNGHVFLLEEDTTHAREICLNALIPAPFFEVSDRKGNFFVSGYALRAHPDGTCIHLINNRCSIYQDRFCICRVYPYMLHREPDDKGLLSYRQISGLNEHGEYHTVISEEESQILAGKTIEYEENWLKQMLDFYQLLQNTFQCDGERHVRKIYDHQMKNFRKGNPVVVYVFYKGVFNRHIVTIEDYSGISMV